MLIINLGSTLGLHIKAIQAGKGLRYQAEVGTHEAHTLEVGTHEAHARTFQYIICKRCVPLEL